MSDKERLEQIKNRDIKYLLGGTQLAEDWEWLIYQARKAIELEKTIDNGEKAPSSIGGKMNAKERLEEIKLMVKAIDGDFTVQIFGYETNGQSILDDWKWLIKRVEELEEIKSKLIQRWNDEARLNNDLMEQNQRYKQALEFYADEETYETKFATDTDEIYDPFTLIELDEGKKARQALGWEESK